MSSFDEADELKDSRDKEFLEQFDMNSCVGCGEQIYNCKCHENAMKYMDGE